MLWVTFARKLRNTDESLSSALTAVTPTSSSKRQALVLEHNPDLPGVLLMGNRLSPLFIRQNFGPKRFSREVLTWLLLPKSVPPHPQANTNDFNNYCLTYRVSIFNLKLKTNNHICNFLYHHLAVQNKPSRFAMLASHF